MPKIVFTAPTVQLAADEEALLASIDGKTALKSFQEAVKAEFVGAAAQCAALTRQAITEERVADAAAAVQRTEALLERLPEFEGRESYRAQIANVKPILGELAKQIRDARELGQQLASQYE